MRGRGLLVIAVLGLAHGVGCTVAETAPRPEQDAETAAVRLATFNIRELSSDKLKEVDASGVGINEQLRAAATIVQRIRPDILVLNEVDLDYESAAGLESYARRFAQAYLATGAAAIDYAYAWAGASNTGILSGLDLNSDGYVATDADRGERSHGDDSFGFGVYPGQYSIAVLSRFPIAGESARTFRNVRWVDLPGHHIPEGFYSSAALDILRLSSKSHQDLPVQIGETRLHLLLSHPTPPVFDGDEDRNGRRNFDEIMLWAQYLDGSDVLVDDAGERGGYVAGEPFAIVGDLNARPDDTASLYDGRTAISQLLAHEAVRDTADVATGNGGPGDDRTATTAFGGVGARIDYVLPSIDVEVLDGGVFWPTEQEDAPGREFAVKASDHRLVWLDLRLPGR